jgi:hypothetical protein
MENTSKQKTTSTMENDRQSFVVENENSKSVVIMNSEGITTSVTLQAR